MGGIKSNLSWNETSSHFGFGDLGFKVEEEAIFGSQLFKQGEGKEVKKKSRFGTLVFVSMETIRSPTCLWVVRKNLTSIMKVLLVGFCGL